VCAVVGDAKNVVFGCLLGFGKRRQGASPLVGTSPGALGPKRRVQPPSRQQTGLDATEERQHVPPFGEVNRGALHSVLAHQNHSTSSFAVLVTMDVDDLVETDLEGVVPIDAATIR
jgi:hypothetical protein